MPSLDSAARRALRARAHHLAPVVSIGQQGLTPTVIHEIDIALTAHELIKVRVFGDDRAAREALFETICAATDAAPVQHLGKLLVLWRPAPAPEKAVSRRTAKGSSGKPAPRGADRDATMKVASKGRGRDATKKIGAKGRGKDVTKRIGSKGRGRDATKKPFAGKPPGLLLHARGRNAADGGAVGEGSSRRRRGTAAATPRNAPPTGVPRAALPRRRRARG